MTDGCPDSIDTIELFSYQLPDYDNDGVDDRWDQCLDESENYNGFADTDGCPDVIGISNSKISTATDSDEDAIPDNMDLCPTLPERYNGYFDTDGCPDRMFMLSSLSDADFDGIIDTFR